MSLHPKGTPMIYYSAFIPHAGLTLEKKPNILGQLRTQNHLSLQIKPETTFPNKYSCSRNYP